MSNKNPTLFGKEWNFAPPALDENNLVEEDKKDEDEKDDPLAGPTVKAELKVRQMVREALARSEKKKSKR